MEALWKELLWISLLPGAVLFAIWFLLHYIPGNGFSFKRVWKSFLLIVLLPVGCVLLCWRLVHVREFDIARAPYEFKNPQAVEFRESKWVCEEAGVEFYMDSDGLILGRAKGSSEILFLRVSGWHGLEYRHPTGFTLWETGQTTFAEAAYWTERGQGEIKRVLGGSFLGFNEDEMVIALEKRDLPIWGVTEPVELHFVREAAPELYFYGTDGADGYPSRRPFTDFPNSVWICGDVDLRIVQEHDGDLYGEMTLPDGRKKYIYLQSDGDVLFWELTAASWAEVAESERVGDCRRLGKMVCSLDGGKITMQKEEFPLWELYEKEEAERVKGMEWPSWTTLDFQREEVDWTIDLSDPDCPLFSMEEWNP